MLYDFDFIYKTNLWKRCFMRFLKMYIDTFQIFFCNWYSLKKIIPNFQFSYIGKNMIFHVRTYSVLHNLMN